MTRSRWPAHALALAPACLGAVWMWSRALGTFFTSDDLVAIARAAGLAPTSLTFRPLSAVLAVRFEYAAFGLDPLGYHAINLVLHLLATAGVYALALRLANQRGTAAAAALLFACSGIAFTPLHAASGIGDLLACVLLLGATLVHLRGRQRGRPVLLWLAPVIAALAALAKESAAAWPLVALALEWRSWRSDRSWRAVLPALAGAAASAIWFTAAARVPAGGAYALDFSPRHLATNLATYLAWCAEVGRPMRDVVAAANPGSLPAALAVVLGVGLALRWERGRSHHPVEAGLAWWLAFVLPALPLAHHTYLYYLYIPWAGGAVAVAAAGAALIGWVHHRGAAGVEASEDRRRAWLRPTALTALLALAAFVAVEARGVGRRERAAFDALPADRTLREAALLAHALPALRAAGLPPGTPIGFVNPAPRAAFELPSLRSPSGDVAARRLYIPLEAALRSGDAFRLFAPGLVDSGFAVSIPPGWERVECFLYEQRGWLRRWGHGQDALMRQGELQAAAARWAAAESSFARVRSLGDTLPAAICGQVVAQSRLGRAPEAAALADTFARRWPGDSRASLLGRLRPAGPVDPALIQPFDRRLAVEAEPADARP